jgi:hypothetical protein
MSFLYIAYHHNWSGKSDFRRHWLLFLTTERGSNVGTAYDVARDEHEVWILRIKENHDISASGTYQDKVVLGLVDNSKVEQLAEIINDIALPSEGEDCQDWVKHAVTKLVAEKVAPTRALASMGVAPSS